MSLDLTLCRQRQARVRALMDRLDLDLVIVSRTEHVQYLAGPRFEWLVSPCAALDRDGKLTLVAPEGAQFDAAIDARAPYPARQYATLRNDQGQAASAALLAALPRPTSLRRVGAEFSALGLHAREALPAEWIDVEPALFELRRRKDPDELELLKRAIAATQAMHARAREIVAPGISELSVFSALQAAAVEACGEMLTATGNDYACGARGGPPRPRALQAGELYILDLGPAYQGYFADNTRTLAVDGRPTPEQRRAAEKVAGVFPLVEGLIRPGASCRAVFETVERFLNEAAPWGFGHHLGHGIGLFPHEAPHLNPRWDDTFQAGEVIAVEPGLYAPELRAGVRLENNYLVTESGVELLTPFPLGLS